MDATHHTLQRQISINERFGINRVDSGGGGGGADDIETEKFKLLFSYLCYSP